MTELQTLRRTLKQARRTISPAQARLAESRALQRVAREPGFRRARRIAAYFGSKGELDPTPLLADIAQSEKVAYVPVLHPFEPGRLWFCRWHEGDPLIMNRYGIPEPRHRRGKLLAARQLDLVIVPLLGFDSTCHRLGMGGGYYDRSLAFRNRFRLIRRPLLIGLAYDLQHVDELQTNPWDVQLDLVVTPSRVYRRTPHQSI